MNNVIVINSDDYGVMGVAQNYKTAIDCLLDWTGHELCYYDNNLHDFVYLTNEEDFKEIYNLSIDEFNEIFDGEYFLDIEPLW